MKKSIVATLIPATLVISVVAAACGEVMPVAVPANGAAPDASLGAVVVAGTVAAAPDEERLAVMQSSIGTLISDSLNRGLAVPEYLYDQTYAIEQAKEALRQLDGQMDGLQMLVAQHVATGTCPPECLFDAIRGVEQARSEALIRIGIVD